MPFDDAIELIKTTGKANDRDEVVETAEKRVVFATVKAVGQREATEARASGLKPSVTFRLSNRADYDDEQRILYSGKKYRIIRTFFRDDAEWIELICERLINKG